MTQITNLLSSYISIPELNDLSANIVALTKSAKLHDNHLDSFVDKMGKKNDELSLSFNQERTSEHTKKLSGLDEKRDDWFKCLKMHIKADMFRPDEKISKAAEKVYQVLKNHGLQLYSESYERQSALLEALFRDLEEPKMVKAISLLNLAEVYIQLKDAQAAFKKAYLTRSESATNELKLPPAHMLHKEVLGKYEKLAGYLNLMVDEEPKKFSDLVTVIDDLITNINAKIRASRSNGESSVQATNN